MTEPPPLYEKYFLLLKLGVILISVKDNNCLHQEQNWPQSNITKDPRMAIHNPPALLSIKMGRCKIHV